MFRRKIPLTDRIILCTSVNLVYSYTFLKIANKARSKISLELAFTCTLSADHERRRQPHWDGSSGGHGHAAMNSLFHFSSSDAWASSRLMDRARRGIHLRSSTWPRWLPHAMKITTVVHGDDQHVGRGRSLRSLRRRGCRLLLLNYKADK